jgi:hypothetical protein
MFFATHGESLLKIDLKVPLKPFPTTNELMILTVAGQTQAYSAKFSSIQFRTQFDTSQSNMPFDTFIDHLWKALLAKTDKHGCKITSIGSTVQLELYFYVAEGISLTLAKLDCQRDQSQSFISVAKEMVDAVTKLQENETKLKQQLQKMTLGRDHVLQKYEAFEKERNLADTDIFQKFALVLNEKKRKIKELSQ